MYSRQFYQEKQNLVEYKEFIINILELFNSTNPNISQEVSNMINLEAKLARVSNFLNNKF